MKILHTADFHIKHKHKYSKVIDGKIWDQLFMEKMKVLDTIKDIADEHNVDAIVVAGDVFDTTNPPEPIKAAFCEWVNRVRSEDIWLWVIAGNHETSSYGNHALMDIAEAYRGEVIYDEGAISSLWTSEKIGVFHFMVEGVDDLYKKTVPLNDERFKPFKWILLGDYHGLWYKKYGDKMFIYSGSPYPTRFGEPEGGVNIIDFDTGKIKRVKTHSYQLLEFNVNFGEDINFDINGDFKYVVKYNVSCGARETIGAAKCFDQYKIEQMKKKRCIDFVYVIKVNSSKARVDGDVNNKSIDQVAIDHINKNCRYASEAIELYQEIRSCYK